MQTDLAPHIRDTEAGQEAEAILRKCTHCGFCLATCPTYQLLGDELDSPRGRIYLMKQVLEGHTPGPVTQLHLDRCLTCRNCESTCPSGVQYGRLVDIGRELVEEQRPRPASPTRWALRRIVPNRRLFTGVLRLGQALRPLLPAQLREKIPPHSRPSERGPQDAPPGPEAASRRVVVPRGCVEPALTPQTRSAAVRLLGRLGIATVPVNDGCCGAVEYHMADTDAAKARIRANIDAWWPAVEDGAEAVVVTASGCGAMVKEYGYILRNDPEYAERARRIAELAVDPVEVLAREEARLAPAADAPTRIAFHCPCTLQHGQKLHGRVERLLRRVGFELVPVRDPHLCCGSAGTYSILQPKLARQLRDQRLDALTDGDPQCIATANVGCQTHLAAASPRPVHHWLELLDVQDATGVSGSFPHSDQEPA